MRLGTPRLRIGIMLRHFAQHNGGLKNYTRRLLDRLLPLAPDIEYVLMYADKRHVGTYASHPNVREVAVHCRSALVWDQFVVPYLGARHGLHLIFNPKFSVPLLARCATVWVCHGLDWYVMPWGSPKLDRLSHKFLIPRYADKAAGIVTVSRSTYEDVQRFLQVPEERLQVIYHGISQQFQKQMPADRIESISCKYNLPSRFLLYVGGVYPAKNFGRLIEAYSRVGPEAGIHLVIAGEHTYMCEDDFALPARLGLDDWVRYPGWIEHDELPAFYRRATALVLPSLYEACPSPILEAMATGCPVLTGDRTGMSEIAGGAALLVNPDSVTDIASGMQRIATDASLRSALVKKGEKRAAEFDWNKCARETLRFLEKTAKSRRVVTVNA